MALLLGVFAQTADAQEPRGGYVQGGIAGIPGVGLQIGYVSAESFFTRELNLVADLQSFSSDGVIQTAGTIGGAVRVFGIGRTIGDVAYRGFDLDVGFRIGPALSFKLLHEDRAFRNRRFNLFLEPFARWTSTRWGRLFFIEAGVHSPILRFGLWWKLGGRAD